MKTKMIRVGGNGHGYKKARFWNMASFQPRKWRQAMATQQNASTPSPLPGSASPAEPTHQNNPPPPPVPASPPTAPPEIHSRHSPGPCFDNTKPALGTPQSAIQPLRGLCDPAANSFSQPETRNAEPETSSTSSLSDLNASAMNSTLPHSQPPPPRTRTGKIARLPLDLREEVNEMLRSGDTYQEIALKLAEHGIGDINASNISNWKHGGYVDWLREQQETERSITLPFALERCTRNIQLDRLQQNALIIATGQLSQIINRFDVQRALDVLHEKPELLPSFISSLTSVGRCGADLAKTFELVHTREQTVRDQLHSSPRSSRGHETHFDDVAQPLPNGESNSFDNDRQFPGSSRGDETQIEDSPATTEPSTDVETTAPFSDSDRSHPRAPVPKEPSALNPKGSDLESPKHQPLTASTPDAPFKPNEGHSSLLKVNKGPDPLT